MARQVHGTTFGAAVSCRRSRGSGHR
jgi:hypothetical protein